MRGALGAAPGGPGTRAQAIVAVGGETLVLLPQKAVFLPAHRTLLVADAHFGKALAFRRAGVPVPHGTTSETLAALASLVAGTGAARVVVLGDFLHSASARSAATFDAIARWRAAHPGLALTLVRGNHDRHAGDPPAALRVDVVDEPLALGGLALAHHAEPRADRYVLAGHLHPCVVLGGRAHDRLRLPCFHFGAQVGVLPAFGAFTGMQPIRAADGDRVFAIADDEVVQVHRHPRP